MKKQQDKKNSDTRPTKRQERTAQTKWSKGAIGIGLFSLLLSIFTLLGYNVPLFKEVLECVDSNANGVLIVASLVVIMLAANYLIYYVLIYLLRIVGRVVIALLLICNSLALYFINTYEVLITSEMMGNVFNTRYSEASGYFSLAGVLYFLLLGLLPAIYVVCRKVEVGSIKRFATNFAVSIAIILCVGLCNLQNTLWIDRNVPKLGSIILPYSYAVNSIRYYSQWKRLNQKEILLPDAKIADVNKSICVVVIGESARRANFSLYGYERTTNPLLANDGVTPLIANSAATYTTAGVKAILDHKPVNELYEILPNYLYRTGVDVIWRSTNWGEPPLHIEKHYPLAKLRDMYPELNHEHDAILLEGLREQIEASDKDKIFVVLHCSTSHGPTYYRKYPSEFERFTPVCRTVEMADANIEELVNAYDNTILYTDYLLHSLIELLSSLTERDVAMLYVSDHGESLGEDNLYMHGMPMNMAPKEQYEIPFIVWESSDKLGIKSLDKVGQYHIFHSVLRFLGIESPIYDESLNIFEATTK